MRELALPFAVGALCGSRTLLGPAFVGRDVVPRGVHRMILVFAAGELIADKSARIGNRTDALPLTARITMGALSAAASRDRRRGRAALLGALGAVAGSYAWFHIRRLTTARLGATNVVAGLAEDAIAIGLGALLLGSGARPRRPSAHSASERRHLACSVRGLPSFSHDKENGVPALLTLVDHHPEKGRNRLRLAVAHLQAAVAHINNESQSRIKPATEPSDVEQFRLVVCALNDVIGFLIDESSASRPAATHTAGEVSPPPRFESRRGGNSDSPET